jgi:hypothetical protein
MIGHNELRLKIACRAMHFDANAEAKAQKPMEQRRQALAKPPAARQRELPNWAADQDHQSCAEKRDGQPDGDQKAAVAQEARKIRAKGERGAQSEQVPPQNKRGRRPAVALAVIARSLPNLAKPEFGVERDRRRVFPLNLEKEFLGAQRGQPRQMT